MPDGYEPAGGIERRGQLVQPTAAMGNPACHRLPPESVVAGRRNAPMGMSGSMDQMLIYVKNKYELPGAWRMLFLRKYFRPGSLTLVPLVEDSEAEKIRPQTPPPKHLTNPMNSILKSKSSFRAAILAGSIAALFIPAKGMATDAFFMGSAGDHNLTTGSNWVGGSAAGDWDRMIFGSDVVDGTLNLNNFNGRSGITLTSGLTQDITIVNNQPLIMGAVTSDGFIDMSAATHNLTINTQYWDWSPIEWNVGAGATLFVNGGIYENGSHSLTKDGAGNAWITAAGNRTGTTNINGGALVALRSTLGTGAVVINNGGTLYVNDQWVLCGVNGFGVAEQNVASVTVNAGGQLALDGGNGYANGATNLYLNGGSVTGGPTNASPFGGLYLYNGNEQITAGGATTSTISAILALTGNNNSITVGAGSSLNITNVIKNGIFDGSAAGGFIKAGDGTLTLTGANSYSGGTTVSGGTLQIGNGGSTGSYGTGPVTNNATLVWNNTSGLDVVSSNAITGTGDFTIKAGVVRVLYDNSGSVSSGTITVDGTGSSNNSSYEIWAGNGATIANNFVLNSMGPAQFRGAINQDGGGGLVTLNGSITLAGDSRIGTGGGSWNSMDINGQVTGGGKLYVWERHDANPSTQLTLNNSLNNYSGGTEIEQGRLRITQATALGTGPVTITGANSQLLVDEVSGTIPNNFTLGGGGNPTSTNYAYGNATMLFHNDAQTATLSGTVTLAGDAKIRGYSGGGTTNFSNPIGGTGNLTFEAGGATLQHTQLWTLQGSASTFTGNVNVSSDGTANAYLLLNGGGLPSTAILTLADPNPYYFIGYAGNNAVLDLNGQNQTLAGLLETNGGHPGTGTFVTNSGNTQSTLTINNSAADTFTGIIGVNTAVPLVNPGAAVPEPTGLGNIAVVKSGVGTLILAGANTYTGGTTINGGTMEIAPGGSIGTGALTVANGTLMLDSNNLINSVPAVTIGAGSTVTQTTANGWSTLNNLTLQGGTLESKSEVLSTFGTYYLPGTVTVSGSSPSVVTNGSGASGNQFINMGIIGSSTGVTTFDVGDVTGSASADLTVSTKLGNEPLGGTAGLIKTGAGTMVLSANNTYTGTTTVNGGTLELNNAIGTIIYTGGNISINNGSTLKMSGGNQYWFDGKTVAFGAGGGTFDTGTGMNIVSGTYPVGGSGFLFTTTAGTTSTISGSSGINANGNTETFDVASTSNLNLTSFVWNSGNVIKQGVGTLTMSGANSYTGTTTVNNGTLQISNPAVVTNTSNIIVNGGEIYFDPNNDNATIATPITLNGGQLRTYVEQSQLTFSGPVTLGGNSQIQGFAAGSTLYFTNDIGGTGNLTFLGSGADSTHKDFMVISGASNFTGDLYIDNYAASAEVKLSGGDNRLPATAVVHIGAGQYPFATRNSSSLDLNGNNQMIAGLSDSGVSSLIGNRSVVNTSGTPVTLTLNTPANQSFSGTIGGTDINGTTGNNLSLVKSGAGTQTLSGANTYTGTTTVSAGRLEISNSNTSSIVINGGTLGGAGGSTSGTVTVNSGSIDPGTGTGTAGMLNINGLTLTGGSLKADLITAPTGSDHTTGSYDKLVVNGAIALGAGVATLNPVTGLTAVAGQIFYLLDNISGNTTTGNFVGLPEGATFMLNSQTYKITYQANAEGNSFTGGNDVAIELAPSGYPYSQYVTEHSGLGAANESTANDGILNLLKYALGVSTPTVYSGQLITYSLSNSNENQITFTRPQTGAANFPSDISSYTVQVSSDLVNWTNIPPPAPGAGTGTETITVTDTGFPTTGGPRFIRLVVTN